MPEHIRPQVPTVIRRWRGSTRRATLAVAILAALLLSGGLASAAIPDSGTQVISGCYSKIGGILRVINAEGGATCKSWELPISWNQAGVPGEDGTDGVDGTNGTNGVDGTNGTNGVDGTNGTNGVDGTNGTNGVDGTNGTNGVDGVSVTSVALDPGDAHCPSGGTVFTSSSGDTYACNGSDGEDFAGSFTSPSGQFSVTVSDTGATLQGPGGSVRVTGTGVSVQSAGNLTVQSAANLTVMGGGTTNVQGALLNLNGSTCGALQPADFTTVGTQVGIASLLTGPGSPTVRFAC